ncbi:MAG: PDZ domain-containing protein [Ruminococcaceae bacterium]|nr:PDZ domain-containing protein [Oscillospiraceae bacterium]
MKRITAFIITFVLIMGLGVSVNANEYTESERGLDVTLQLIDLFGITDKGNSEIIKEALLNLANEDKETLNRVLNALASTVDEYSMYYSEEEYNEFLKDISGTVYGIGVTAIVEDGAFMVVTLLDGGAAKEAGLERGDKIIEADGVDITGKRAENASTYITGEEGTFVNIKVKKPNGNIVSYTLQRRKVIVPSVTNTVLDDSIGYILINSFTENTHIEVEKVLKELKDKKIDDIIIDLRYNGGGVMDSGIATAELFMEKDKVIISTKDKDEEIKYYMSQKDGYDFNTVLLTNEYTASASEIFACALIDNGYAVSVGKTTFGKACAQGLYPIGIGGALRLTVLNYYTPKGEFINKEGIKVTHFVENEKYKLSEDQLPKLSYTYKFKNGDTNEEVEKIETMLYNLNYLSVTPDTVYDENTMSAVIKFQSESGLYPYGVCDLTTQTYLLSAYADAEFTEDSQLKYAIELLK